MVGKGKSAVTGICHEPQIFLLLRRERLTVHIVPKWLNHHTGRVRVGKSFLKIMVRLTVSIEAKECPDDI